MPKRKGVGMMRLRKLQLASLLMLPFVLGASACDKQDGIRVALPPAPDLVVEAKPIPTEAILTDSNEEAKYNSAIEAWGERGWDAVARLCRWAADHGSKVPCPD